MAIKPTPFTLRIPDADIADLRDRLSRSRFPDQAPGAAWAYGTDVDYLRQLTEYWRSNFDWRAEEAALNAFPQFRVPLDGIDLHYLHVPGVGPDPMPLLLLHGWPGSVFEFLEIIPRLTDPARFGGDARDAFTVVAPSLPGYGLSFRPGQKRFGVPEMADCVAALMHDVLGYYPLRRARRRLGSRGHQPARLRARRSDDRHPHQSDDGRGPRSLPRFPNPTEEERLYLSELAHWMREETGYQWIQGTRPQTLAFGLTDSPAGLAAWIVEKFRAWSDCDGDVEQRDRPGPHACRHLALLVYGGDRIVVLALLCPSSRLGDPARRRYDLGAHRLRAIPARNPQAAAHRGGARVHRHSSLEHHAERRAFRSVGTAAVACR